MHAPCLPIPGSPARQRISANRHGRVLPGQQPNLQSLSQQLLRRHRNHLSVFLSRQPADRQGHRQQVFPAGCRGNRCGTGRDTQALAESQFTEGSFSFQLFQVQQNRLTTLNLPKENITLCSAFVLQMINATHFAPTIDCNHVTGSPRRKERIILSAVAQIGSPYADWEMQIIPLYGGPATAVSMELV